MRPACILLVAPLFLAHSTLFAAEPPTNRELIAAMPETIESVLVVDSALLGNACSLKTEIQRAFFVGSHEDGSSGTKEPTRDFVASQDENNLDRVIFTRALKLKPIKRVLGGAEFVPPQGIGVGSFRYTSIWITEEANTSLKKEIEQLNGVTSKELEGLTVFKAPVEFRLPYGGGTQKKTAYAVFPNEHIVIVGFDEQDVTPIAKSLTKRSATLPKSWKKVAAGIDLNAPLVVLRNFAQPDRQYHRYKNFDYTGKTKSSAPPEIEFVKVHIDGFALTSNCGPEVKFKLHAITDDPGKAEGYFYGGTFHGGFMPNVWTWETKQDQDGFNAQISYQKKDAEHMSGLITLGLFGVQAAI